MKVMFAFLGERRREFCGYIVFAGIFAAVSYLYNIRMDAVQYAFVLSAVWFVLFIVWDYIRYIRRHREVAEMEQRLDSGLDCVPDPVTLIEEDYQRAVMKLYEARRELESSNRIIRQEMADYYGMWVHQIKTPLSAMALLLQSYDAKEEADIRFVRDLRMELFKVEQYVEMVLVYLRMEDMSSDLSFAEFSLDDLIRQAVRKYSRMFIMKKIKLDYETVNSRVLTDEKWLVFVLEQLLSNALKYTRSGRISIHMEGKELVVEDTGIGIQAEDLPRVFEKGFTGYNGRTDKKSTGIGLYLCKSVMDKLRHQIRIESEVGIGTKIYLNLTRL